MTRRIRPLKSSDRDNWNVLWKGYQDYYEVDLSENEDALFARLMKPNEDGPFCLICEEDGQMLGLTQFVYHQTTFGSESRCYLHDLYTVPQARGKRVGEELIIAVKKDATGKGVPKIYWMTQDFNRTARKLYDRIGELTPFIKYQL